MANAKPKSGQPTQRYLDIAEIREDCVVMKDGTLRAVLMVSSINFALKSEDEQQAIIQGYMQFLNGLDFPLQVVIQSRRMNVDGYLASLKAQEDTIHNELLRTQIRDYTSFIKELVELGQIMQKRFFVVVPYDPAEGSDKGKGFLTKLSSAFSPAKIIKLNEKNFQARRETLMRQVSTIASGLGSMSLQVALLDTQGLIELYYSSYNPDVYDTEKLVDVGKLRVETHF
ncbi:MAG: hypothetical protein AAB473_04830 [Patescibacteria group bacterium]